jgi:acetylornithine/succinyldiaminopimelate/putrescine aminotransferase
MKVNTTHSGEHRQTCTELLQSIQHVNLNNNNVAQYAIQPYVLAVLLEDKYDIDIHI